MANSYNLRSRLVRSSTNSIATQSIDHQRIQSLTTVMDATTKAFEIVKSFQGTSLDNSRDWCDRAEIIFNAFNVNDIDRLARIAIKLEGVAFDWYRTNPGPYPSWMVFREIFEKAFPPPARTPNRHLLAEQINQRKQRSDESVHDYYYSLDNLCRDYDPHMSAADKAIKLVSGLRDDLKEKLLPLNLQTPEQFMIQAKNYESSHKVMENHRQQHTNTESFEPIYTFDPNYSTVATSEPYQQQPQQSGNFHQRYQIYPRHVVQPINNQQQQFQRMNHRQIIQPLRNNRPTTIDTNQQRDLRKCYQCGQQGHLQRFCPHHLKE